MRKADSDYESRALTTELLASIDNAQNLPNFCQSPTLEAQDAVAVLEGRDAVRDHDHGQPVMQGFEGLDEFALCIEVEGAGRLIEHQQRRFVIEGPRDADSLALPA